LSVAGGEPRRKTVLGNEYDNQLRRVLMEVLKELGGQVRSKDWGVAGSQEIESLEVEIGGRCILVEAETFIGLSITGENDLIERIAALVKRRREAR